MHERTIFENALDLHDPAARAAYIAAACGRDAQLQARVAALLDSHEQANSFLQGAAVATIDRDNAPEYVGTNIGPYKIREQIGEGGMGVVYVAEQTEPVRRKVALKIIRPGMATRDVIARFEAERQALAMMDHPNIARVFDAGATGPVGQALPDTDTNHRTSQAQPDLHPTPDTRHLTPHLGQPYFVMELVQGLPITEYCDQCNITTRERLELFVTVCQAVQHAHQKGIIHRDIKPTNVLVAIQDGQPAPKIIDFGVAKAIEQRLTEHTRMTAFAQLVGTPLYMSPEQAELSPLGVDTRSDIYSLGVLLYELLTGATPFDKDRLHAAGYDELRRIIREEEPPRPSARISTLAADLATTVAGHRQTETRYLSKQIRGELDWIVMKCLEKDRNRRYETPNSLARDIERYLADEPVQACPPSTAYRVRKYARRNKTLLTAGGAIAAALVVGLGLSTWQYFRATTEGARAKAVSEFLQEMVASSNPDQTKGSQYTVREQLDDFSAGLGNQLTGQPEVEADIRSVIGKSYWRLGVYDRAELHSKKALDLRSELYGPGDERVADSLVDYAWNLAEQVRHAEAEKHVRDALAIYRKQNSNPRAMIRAYWSLQRFLISQSRLPEAEEVANDAIALASKGKESDFPELPAILHGLADAKSQQGKYAEAQQWARQAVDMHRRLHGDHHPETAWGLLAFGQALRGQQKFDDAEPQLREALAIFREYYGPEHSVIQRVSQELKSVLEASGDETAIEALASEQAELASRSDSPANHVRLAELLLAETSLKDDRKAEARRLIRRAMDDYGRMAADAPHDQNRGLEAVDGYLAVATPCLTDPDDFAQEIDEVYRLRTEELKRLVAEFPDSVSLQNEAAFRYRYWAFLVEGVSRCWPQYENSLRQSIVLFEKVSLKDPKLPAVQSGQSAAQPPAVTLTQIGSPIWRPADFQVFSAPGYTDEDRQRTRAAIRPLDRRDEPYTTPHGPPYDSELSTDMAAAGFISRSVFPREAIMGNPNVIHRAYLLLPDPGITGSSRDFASGPVIPNSLFPLSGHSDVWKDGALSFDGGDFLVNVRPTDQPFDGASHRTEFGCLWRRDANNLGNYEFRSSLRDTEGHGWDIVAPFRIVAEPRLWFFLASSCVYFGDAAWVSAKTEDAEAAFQRAMEIYDQHRAEVEMENESDPEYIREIVRLYTCVAYYLSATDRAQQAADYVARASASAKRLTDPTFLADSLYYVAIVQARLGDTAGYRATCETIVKVPISEIAPRGVLRPIVTPCLLPGALEDPSVLIKLAEEVLATNPLNEASVGPYLLGSALHRAGQFEQAAKQLERAIELYPSGPPLRSHKINSIKLRLAMTKWQLGQRDAARELLSKTLPAVEAELQNPISKWNSRATIELMRGEAKALIGPKEADEAVENENRIDDSSPAN